jgi:rhodanese-related sulfurtransferase
MKFFIVIAGAVILAFVLYKSYKRRALDKIFQLPPGAMLVIDVRTKEEFDRGHFSTALNIPVDMVENQLKQLEPYRQRTIVLYCQGGVRSAAALRILKRNGFPHVVNAGGYASIRKYDANPSF